MTRTEARQAAIARLLRGGDIGSQAELVARLADQGVTINQATVSRDLDSLGAVRVKRDGRLCYRLPETHLAEPAPDRLDHILGEWLTGAESLGNLMILRTRPGSAHVVAAAIDRAQLSAVAGSIAGDDTLFLALRDAAAGPALLDRFRAAAPIA